MTSHRKRVGRRSRSSPKGGEGASRATSRERLSQLLSTTTRRVLALAGAVGVVTGAVAGVLALLPKPKPKPDVHVASFAGVMATPEVSLEQYDVRASSTVVGGTRTASVGHTLQIGGVSYRLAADTTTPATGPEGEAGNTGTTGTTPAATTNTGEEPAVEPTVTHTTTTPATTPAKSTPATQPTPPPRAPGGRVPGHRPTPRRVVKRRGARITQSSPAVPYPQEQSEQAQQAVTTPPAQPLHPVAGALVSEGAGVSHESVATVASLLSAKGAEAPEPVAGTSPGGEAATSTPTTPTTGAEPSASEPARHVVLPGRCGAGTCGATQEIEKALTYDPNPVKAAQAVSAIFNDSRAEVVGRNLYPLGAEVSFNVSLKGYAGEDLTVAWTLVGRADKRALARPWWRDIVVAHVKSTVDEESLPGSFWVPMPPERGDYLVKVVLLDPGGNALAVAYSAPAFH